MKALHVLVVEDDADHVFLVRRALADVAGTEVQQLAERWAVPA